MARRGGSAPRPPSRPPSPQSPRHPAAPTGARWSAETGHDLRQSLQAATVQAHALVLQARQQAQPGWAQLGQQMAESLQHCHALLESLLAGAQAGPPLPAATLPTPDWQAVDLGPLLDALVQAWQPVAEQRGLQLRLQRPSTAPRVRSDALLLRRVLDNLLGNALANTAAGGVDVQCQAAADAGQAGPVISLRDTGPGLASTAAQPASAAGHGLGLMIVRRLCATLGIAFDLQGHSGQGSGTVARLAWPADAAAKVQAVSTAGAADGDPRTAPSPAPGSG